MSNSIANISLYIADDDDFEKAVSTLSASSPDRIVSVKLFGLAEETIGGRNGRYDTMTLTMADYCGLFVDCKNIATLSIDYCLTADELPANVEPKSIKKFGRHLIDKPETSIAGLSTDARHGILSIAALILQSAAVLTDLDLELDATLRPLEQTYYDYADFKTLTKSIAACHRLKWLHLDLMRVDHLDWTAFRFPDLRKFELSLTGDVDGQTPTADAFDEKAVTNDLLTAVKTFENLESIDFYAIDLPFGTFDLADALTDLKQLESIRYSISEYRTTMSAAFVAAIREIGPRLKSIDLTVSTDAAAGVPEVVLPSMLVSCSALTDLQLDLSDAHLSQPTLIGMSLFGPNRLSTLDLRSPFVSLLPLVRNHTLTDLRLTMLASPNI